MSLGASPRSAERDDPLIGGSGSPRPLFPTTPASSSSQRGLNFASPPMSSRSASYTSPDRTSSYRVPVTSSTSARFSRSRPLNGLVTPASSLSSRMRSLGSPDQEHGSNITASSSKISQLFADLDRQKEINESKLSLRIRELEEEKNRILGENEVLNYEVSKARQNEGKLKREIDELKEKNVSLKRDMEAIRRDEEGKRRSVSQTLEEVRQELASLEAERTRLAKDLEAAQKMIKCLEQELEEERIRSDSQVDNHVKRAIEKERKQWEKEEALRSASQQEENESMRKKCFEMETLAMRRQGEIDELRKQLERLKNESERERQALINESSVLSDRLEIETQGLRSALESSESERKKLETALNDARLAEASLQKQLDDERARVEQRIAIACKRAVEKELEESRAKNEASLREEARRRQELENAFEEARKLYESTLEDKLVAEKSLEEARALINQLQQELDSQQQLEAQRVELASRRAVERERATLEQFHTQQKVALERELQESRAVNARLEAQCAKLDRELQESRRSSERIRADLEKQLTALQLQLDNCEREHEIGKRSLRGEVDNLILKLATSEEARRKAEREANEVRRLLNAVEVEREADSERFNAKMEAAIRRAIEKDRAEQRLKMESKEREESQQRMLLQRKISELQAALEASQSTESSLTEELEQTRSELRRLRSEFDREKDAWHDDQDVLLKRAEREKRSLLTEKQQLERYVEDLERSQNALLEEHAVLVGIQEQSQAEITELQNRLAEVTTREERLLLELSEMRGRSVQQQLLLRTGVESRRPVLTENLPPPSPTVSKRANPIYQRPSSSIGTPVLNSSSILRSSMEPHIRHTSFLRGAPTLSRRVANAKRLLESDF